MKKKQLLRYNNAVVGVMHNRRLKVAPKDNNIIIEFTIMDGDVKPRSIHKITHKGKAVKTGLMISKESALLLYGALREVVLNFDEMTAYNVKSKD